MVAQSISSEVDKKGRLAIPKELRDYAAIGSELVLIGLYDRLELWSPSRWMPISWASKISMSFCSRKSSASCKMAFAPPPTAPCRPSDGMLEWANVTNRGLTCASPLRRSFGDQSFHCVLMRTPADAWRLGH
jgi:hypothetical protein